MKNISIQIFAIIFCSIASHAKDNDTRILIFGDFGTKDANESLVASDMTQFCNLKSCDFAITVGDNIYPAGIPNSNGTPNFDLIKTTFVDYYKGLNIPHYMVLGNHDVEDAGVVNVKKNALRPIKEDNDTFFLIKNQIDFTKHPDNPSITINSARLWEFPDEYYRVHEKGNVHIFGINTNHYPHRALNTKNTDMHEKPLNNSQSAWLKKGLRNITSGWKIIFGHMPLFSHGHHGNNEAYQIKKFRDQLLPLLCENRVDFYLSGHDHHLEIDKYQCDNGHLLVAIISGAAAKSRALVPKTFNSKDLNLVWANGYFYEGKKIGLKTNTVLGFSYLKLPPLSSNLKDIKAYLQMKMSTGQGSDGCFEIKRGTSIEEAGCQ